MSNKEYMSNKDDVKTSKFLSLVLRHAPETIGIELDENGWTDVQTLLQKASKKGIQIDMDTLKHIVATSPKQRFAFDDTFTRIRANQGHSVKVELGYQPQQPPEILYHGTGEKFVASILETGLDKRSRHHVHLSKDIETAKAVGQRHGRPHVFEVLAGEMYRDGYVFYVSENGVWLTDAVPVGYLRG